MHKLLELHPILIMTYFRKMANMNDNIKTPSPVLHIKRRKNGEFRDILGFLRG